MPHASLCTLYHCSSPPLRFLVLGFDVLFRVTLFSLCCWRPFVATCCCCAPRRGGCHFIQPINSFASLAPTVTGAQRYNVQLYVVLNAAWQLSEQPAAASAGATLAVYRVLPKLALGKVIHRPARRQELQSMGGHGRAGRGGAFSDRRMGKGARTCHAGSMLGQGYAGLASHQCMPSYQASALPLHVCASGMQPAAQSAGRLHAAGRQAGLVPIRPWPAPRRQGAQSAHTAEQEVTAKLAHQLFFSVFVSGFC